MGSILVRGLDPKTIERAAGKELVAPIRSALQGRRYVAPELAQDVLETLAESRPAARSLTPRLRDVVRLLAEGRTMKEIAADLGMSPRTAEIHSSGPITIPTPGLSGCSDPCGRRVGGGSCRPSPSCGSGCRGRPQVVHTA